MVLLLLRVFNFFHSFREELSIHFVQWLCICRFVQLAFSSFCFCKAISDLNTVGRSWNCSQSQSELKQSYHFLITFHLRMEENWKFKWNWPNGVTCESKSKFRLEGYTNELWKPNKIFPIFLLKQFENIRCINFDLNLHSTQFRLF